MWMSGIEYEWVVFWTVNGEGQAMPFSTPVEAEEFARTLNSEGHTTTIEQQLA